MQNTTSALDFADLWIDLGGDPIRHLQSGRHIVAAHQACTFAIVPERSDRSSVGFGALALAEAQANLDAPGFVIELNSEQLEQVGQACHYRQFVSVDVRDLVGLVVGQIRLSTIGWGELKTEHGIVEVSSVLMSELRTGDVFATFEQNKSRQRLLFVATADFNLVTGEIQCERATRGGNRAGMEMHFPYGPDFLVFRLDQYDARQVQEKLVRLRTGENS